MTHVRLENLGSDDDDNDNPRLSRPYSPRHTVSSTADSSVVLAGSMHPMRIVNSDETSASCLPLRLRHRGIVFSCGVFVAFLAMALLIIWYRPDVLKPPASPPLPPKWTVQINLTEADTFYYEQAISDQVKVIARVDGKDVFSYNRIGEPSDSSFTVRKLCGNEDWSLVQIGVRSFTDASNSKLLLLGIQNRGSVSPPFMPRVTLSCDDELAELLAEGVNSTSNGRDKTKVGNMLVEAVTGHSLIAKLGHDGHTLNEPNIDNFYNTMRLWIDHFINLLMDQADKMCNTPENRKSWTDELQSKAKLIVKQMKEDIYFALQASPTSGESVGIGGSWHRIRPINLLGVNITYTLLEYREVGPQPRVLLDRKANSHNGSIFVAIPPDRESALRSLSKFNTSRDSKWLIVALTGEVHSNDPRDVYAMSGGIADMFRNTSTLTFSGLNFDVKINGLIVIGAETGVLLEGRIAVDVDISTRFSMKVTDSTSLVESIVSSTSMLNLTGTVTTDPLYATGQSSPLPQTPDAN